MVKKNKRKGRGVVGARVALLVGFVGLAGGWAACDSGKSEPSTNGELHWAKAQALMVCGQDSECGESALRCMCGVCSVPCVPEKGAGACQGAPEGVACTPLPVVPKSCGVLDVAVRGICLSVCSEDAECGAEMACTRGVCVPQGELTDPACRQDLDGDGLRDCDEPYYLFDPGVRDTYGDAIRDRDRQVVTRCPPPSERECTSCEVFGPPQGLALDLVVVIDTSASMAEEHAQLPGQIGRLFESLRARGAEVRLGVSVLGRDPQATGPYELGGGWFMSAKAAEDGARALILGSEASLPQQGLATVRGLLEALRTPNPQALRPGAKAVVMVATDDEDAAVLAAGMPCNDTTCPPSIEAAAILPIASQQIPVIAWTSFRGGLCDGNRATAYSRLGAATGGATIDLCDPEQALPAQTVWSLVQPSFALKRPATQVVSVLVDGREVAAGVSGWQLDADKSALTLGPASWPVTQQVAVVYGECVAR